MDIFSLITANRSDTAEAVKKEMLQCNEVSVHYGLTLSAENASNLMAYREQTLQSTGRVEFSGGIMPKMISIFCKSPYIIQANYEDTLAQLQGIFYNLKNETCDKIPDDDILNAMEQMFNSRAGGSTDYLSQLSWEDLISDDEERGWYEEDDKW